jgi:DNA polymerase-3 subunit beta
MVSTDGYRLSLKDVSGVEVNMEKSQNSGNFLIPARSLIEIVRLASGEQELKVGLTEDENQVIFLLPELQLTSRLIEGEFPEYQKIIPNEVKTKILVDKEEFHQSIRMASVFARESANVVKFKIGKGKIEISSNAPSVGENKTEVGAKLDGNNLEIAFNYRFLLDFLKVIPADEQQVQMEFNESLTPGVFKIPSDEDWLHIIMPVKVDL